MRILRPLSTLLLFVSALVTTGCYSERFNRVALHPSARFRMIPEDLGLDYEILAVPVDGAVIHAWFIPAAGATSAVIVCGGNTGNKEVLLPLAARLHQAGFHVVLPDHRGFGLSTGEPDLWSLVADTVAVVDAIHARPDTDTIGLFGISLGSVAVLGAASAAPDRVDAVAIEGVFSPREVLRKTTGGFLATVAGPIIMPSRWGVEGHVADLEQPLLILHGTRDTITPLASAIDILSAARDADAPRSVWIADGAGHAPGLAGHYGSEYLTHCARFFDGWLGNDGADVPLSVDWKLATAADGDQLDEVLFMVVVAAGGVPSTSRAPIPLELCLVGSSGEVRFHRVWHRGHGRVEYLLAGPSTTRFAAASTPGCPVRRAGGSWRRDSAYRRDRAACEQLEGRLHRGLGYGPPLRMMGAVIYFNTESELPSDTEKLTACRAIDAELQRQLNASIHPWVRARYGEVAWELAHQYVKLGQRDAAVDAYRRFLSLQPENPFAHWWFGDAWWRLGINPEKIASVHDNLARLLTDESVRRRHRTEAATWRRRTQDRNRMLQAWRARQIEALTR